MNIRYDNEDGNEKMIATIIVNPVAGWSKTQDIEEALVQKLESSFETVQVFHTKQPLDAYALARKQAPSSHSIFVCGGDGTVNEVVSGIIDAQADCILGIIPCGTYNAFSRMLKIEQNIQEAINQWDIERTMRIDTGKVNDRYFNYLLSVGDLPEAIHQVSSEDKQKFGPIPYYLNGLFNLISETQREFLITENDQVQTVQASLIILSLSDYFGDFKLTSVDRHLSDGAANLIVIKDAGLLSKIQLLPDLIGANLHSNAEVMVRPVRKLRIECSQGLIESDVDGDLGPYLPLEIEILPKRLRVYYGQEK